MWLCDSSIGRKVVMSVTGTALILFLTFHGLMNVVALFSASGYNWVCEMLGTNWYALAGTAGLAALVVIHFVYAFILNFQNKKARGNNAYAVTSKPEKVEWASQNMLVLGIIVVLGLCVHLFNFWFHMMFAELAEIENNIAPADGYAWIVYTFHAAGTCSYIYSAIYLVWLAALWFHLTHGMWSAMQTMGWSGKIWFNRWRVISYIYSTFVILLFVAVVVVFCLFGDIRGAIM